MLSRQRFQVKRTDGKRFWGLLRKQEASDDAEEPSGVEIIGEKETIELEQREIVVIRGRGVWILLEKTPLG